MTLFNELLSMCGRPFRITVGGPFLTRSSPANRRRRWRAFAVMWKRS
jgi:hypothetical protein